MCCQTEWAGQRSPRGQSCGRTRQGMIWIGPSTASTMWRRVMRSEGCANVVRLEDRIEDAHRRRVAVEDQQDAPETTGLRPGEARPHQIEHRDDEAATLASIGRP